MGNEAIGNRLRGGRKVGPRKERTEVKELGGDTVGGYVSKLVKDKGKNKRMQNRLNDEPDGAKYGSLVFREKLPFDKGVEYLPKRNKLRKI